MVGLDRWEEKEEQEEGRGRIGFWIDWMMMMDAKKEIVYLMYDKNFP